MRGTKAKKLRALVFKGGSHRVRKYVRIKSGQILAAGPRGIYQRAKKLL